MNQAHSQPTNCAHSYYDENDSTEKKYIDSEYKKRRKN